jgi:hypothetical protein
MSALMPIATGIAEICRDILMDSEPLGAEKLTLFVNPLGANNRDGKRKTFQDTNMWASAMLPAPEDFIATGIKVVFLGVDGQLLPVSHPLYWTSSVEFYISNKRYWNSVAAEVVDPILLTNVEEWNKLDLDRKVQLVKRFGNQLIGDAIRADRIIVPAFPEDQKSSRHQPPVDGVMIATQQHFSVQIDHQGKWPLCRVLCVLQGTSWRPVY